MRAVMGTAFELYLDTVLSIHKSTGSQARGKFNSQI